MGKKKAALLFINNAPYIIASVYKSLENKKVPMTGENFRKEMLAIKAFDLPLTGKLVMDENHTVAKPVFLMEVKSRKWTQKAVIN